MKTSLDKDVMKTGEVGSGAFGVIHVSKSDKTRVVKVTHSYGFAPRSAPAVKKEHAACLRLKGKKFKNMVNVHDCLLKDGTLYVQMERLDKLSREEERLLKDILDRRYAGHRRLSVHYTRTYGEALLKFAWIKKERKIIKDIINGAKQLLSVGIIHHDMHSQNFLKNKKGDIKFIDFGIVTLEESVSLPRFELYLITMENVKVITVPYPEQRNHLVVDARSRKSAGHMRDKRKRRQKERDRRALRELYDEYAGDED